MDDLVDSSDATALAAHIRRGDVSAAEVLEATASRLAERNPLLNAVIAERVDAARAEVADGAGGGALAGVPFLVKDLGATVAGLPSTGGSRLFADVVAGADSELVRRYRSAGVVIVGMTNVPELGKNASTESQLHGPTRNPWKLTHSSGGSSGGSAAAVAAGIVPVAHANDGGGSIRIPASMCGLVGLKPTRGRTPNAPGSMLTAPLSVHHVVARSVRDSALLLDLTAGPMAGDPYVTPPPVRPFVEEVGAPVEQLRIGCSVAMPSGAAIDPACAEAVRAAAELLAELGHVVEESSPEFPMEALGNAGRTFMSAPLALDVADRLEVLGRDLAADDLEVLTRMLYESGRAATGAAVLGALRDLEQCGRIVGRWFEGHDLWLSATVARPVPPLGLLDTMDLQAMMTHAAAYSALTSPFNATGQPAISLPLGTDGDGLPVGVQLVAAWGREDLLLRVAAQIEAARPWRTTPVWPARP